MANFQLQLKKRIAKSILISLMFAAGVNAQTSTIQTDVPALKNVYANDFYIGCLLSYTYVGFPTDPYVPGQSSITDPNGGYLIKYHMNSMSPGNWIKSTYIVDINGSRSAYNSAATQAEKDSIDVNPKITFNGNIIAQLNWAQRQGFKFRGHTLVWHNQTPGTSFFRTGYSDTGERLSKEKMTIRMENYIKEVIRVIHEGWPGLLVAFDVVNEAVNDNGTDRSSNNEWYQTFGDNSYIMKAFEFARKYTVQYGETQIKLYYNDYNTSTSSKADGIVRVCTPIYQAGLLDGIGMQEHDQYNSPSASQWIASYNKFYPICDEMTVTELDVKPSSNVLSTSVLTSQANQYAMLFKCFVERSYFSGRGKIISVCKDGLNDQYAFVANASLWDNKDQCKPAFYAVVNVGVYYNKLDSLLTYSGGLKENEYTADSWAKFSSALSFAQDAFTKNYSYVTSAADGLIKANDTLSTAINSLVDISTDIKNANDLPVDFKLYQNYPNPFNPVTQIEYSIPKEGFISLKVYNLIGEEVATLFEGNSNAGKHIVNFDGSNLSSGIYLYQLKANNFVQTKKLALIK
jgi:endo-1,4-beta-xylanase